MNFFKGVWVLTKKETKDAFATPLVYILAGIVSILIGWLFFNYLVANKDITNQTLDQTILLPLFGNMNFVFLFLAPLITMRSFSEEKKLHTIELLLQSDLNHFQIILGKFCSAMAIVIFLLSLTLICPLIISISGYSNWGPWGIAYIGTFLAIMSYIAVGLFASSLTENQIISALLGFSFLMGLMLLVLSSNASSNPLLSQMLRYFAIPFHFEVFVRGAFKSYNLVFFTSFIGFFFYLTHTSLDSRNW